MQTESSALVIVSQFPLGCAFTVGHGFGTLHVAVCTADLTAASAVALTQVV